MESARIDIMAWVTDKVSKNEDFTLNDEKVKEILSDNKSYVKETKKTSFITKKGEYEIFYSELYNNNNKISPQNDWKLASEIFEATGNTEGKMHVGDYINYPIYYENVAGNVDVYSDYEFYYPSDEYTGWRVLSMGGENENKYLVLVSAGIPLNYWFSGEEVINGSIEKLTTDFFNISIGSYNLPNAGFQSCGFKTGRDGDVITDYQDLYTLFDENIYTAKYEEGKIATYTDEVLNQTFTNSNVTGIPKVRSITKKDIESVLGTPITYGYNLSSNNLFAFHCKELDSSNYIPYWIPASYDEEGGYMLNVDSIKGKIGYGNDNCYGIRCVVSLVPNVKFALSEESNSTDTVKVWNMK